jgi:hypothetical protein
MWGRVPLRVWIGLGCISLAAAGYGGWEWWMATRTSPTRSSKRISRRQARSPASLGVGQDFPWAPPLRRPITGLPNFGLVAGIIVALPTMVRMLLGAVTRLGLWAHLLKPGLVPAESDSWTDPLIARLVDEGAGKEPELLVNSKQVRWDDLRTFSRTNSVCGRIEPFTWKEASASGG